MEAASTKLKALSATLMLLGALVVGVFAPAPAMSQDDGEGEDDNCTDSGSSYEDGMYCTYNIQCDNFEAAKLCVKVTPN